VLNIHEDLQAGANTIFAHFHGDGMGLLFIPQEPIQDYAGRDEF
jgi:hypothetical protein